MFLNNEEPCRWDLVYIKQLPMIEVENAIAAAVKNGYRLIDTASAYKTKRMWTGIARCGIPRKDLFITTKDLNKPASEMSMMVLFSEVWIASVLITLIFISFTGVPGCYLKHPGRKWRNSSNPEVPFLSVSAILRFVISKNSAKVSGIVPAVNQIECHPLCYPKGLLNTVRQMGGQPHALWHEVLIWIMISSASLGCTYSCTGRSCWVVQKGESPLIPRNISSRYPLLPMTDF